MSNAAAVRKVTPQQFLDDPNKFLELKRALPKNIDAERIKRIALTELSKSADLNAAANDNPLEFFGAVVQAAQLGLEIGSGLGHCYLIVYKGRIKLQLGYQGMIELAYRTGKIKSFDADLVVESDVFVHKRTQDGLIFEHEIDWNIDVRDQTNVKLAYAQAVLVGGGSVYAVMTNAQIQKNESENRKGKDSTDAWRKHWGEMAKKTVIRRLYKLLPKSAEMMAVFDDEDGDYVKTDYSKLARDAGITIDAATGKEIPRSGASASDTSLTDRMAMEEEQ